MTLDDNKKLTVVNLLAGAGCGKSVLAARLFAQMSIENFNVELVHESAKDFTWEDWEHIFPEQDYITAHQHRLIRRLVRHNVDYAVVDSSLLLAEIYAPDWFPRSYFTFLMEQYNSYDNINIVIQRNPKLTYKQAGRNQTYTEATVKDRQVIDVLHKYNLPYHTVMAGDGSLDKAMEIIRQHDIVKHI